MGTATILGTSYPTVIMPDGKEWMAASLAWEGAGVDYDDNPANRPLFGRLYTLAETLALSLTSGWRVPAQGEWLTLATAVGGGVTGGGSLKSTDTAHWDAPNVGAVDLYGFSGRGTGLKFNGSYGEARSNGYTWCSDADSRCVMLQAANAYIGFPPKFAHPSLHCSVRLVRDYTPHFTGLRVAHEKGIGDTGTASILGRTYSTVVLPDGREWMASGLDYTPLTEYGGYNADNVATIAALLTDGWRFPTLADANDLLTLVPNPTELAKIRTTFGWTSTQGTNTWGASLYPGGYMESGVLWHDSGSASMFWLSGATQVLRVTDLQATINNASGYLGNLTTRKFTIRLVRDAVPQWRNAPEVHVAYEKNIGDLGTSEILGTSYPTRVMPDGKEWMTQNLAYAGVGQWWNNGASDDGDGRYYTRAEALALSLPSGWRLPTEAEILALGAAVGGMSTAGKALKVPGTAYWATDTGALDALGFSLHGSGRYWGNWQTKRTVAFLWLGGAGKPYWWADDNASPLWVGTDGTHTVWRCPLRLVRDVSRKWRKSSRIFVPGEKDVGDLGTSDILGTTYPTVVMPDGKEWLAENLRYTSGSVSTVAPGGNAANVAAYGYLYSRASVDVIGALLADGWRVASKAEYADLFTAIGGMSVAGGKLKATGTMYWDPPNVGATDEFGFSSRGSGGYNGVEAYGFRVGNRTWARDSVVGGGIVEGVGLGGTNGTSTSIVAEADGGYVYWYAIRLVRDIPAGAKVWREVTK